MSIFLASKIGDFASGLRYDEIPSEVREAALLHIVDSIGVSIAGANPREDSGKAAASLVRQWDGAGDATIFGLGAKLRSDLSALVNGSMAQALEMDDKHGPSLARPGSTVIPAVLAAGEASKASLKEVITAIVVGYETMIRLGFIAGDRFLARGYHTSSLLGSFGVVAAIGNLRRMPSPKIVDALGIAGTFASGIQESTRTGSTSKILHGGWGAHAGMIAADFAGAGISGPDSVFEGEFGFFKTHLSPISGDLDFLRGAEGLGELWYLPETAFKPYPCCQLLHAFVVAAKQILTELRADGAGPSQITAIACRLAEPGLTLVTEPKDRKKAPTTPHEARFSLPFAVAATILDGEIGLETFRPERLGDPQVLKLAALVSSAEDPNSDYPAHCPAILEVEAADKLYRSHVPYHPGSPEAPLLKHDVLDKFARNTSWHLETIAREVGAELADFDHGESLENFLLRTASQVDTTLGAAE